MMTAEQFKLEYVSEINDRFAKPLDDCTNSEKYDALVGMLRRQIAPVRKDTSFRHRNAKLKKIYYFSMEFLIGPLLQNYLLNLGMRDEAEQGLRDLGIDPFDLYSIDKDPGLGNGGLGRLAACFLDSMAALAVPGVGMGLRYRYGLFKQRIDSGIQFEEPDDWLETGYAWESAKPAEAVEVRYGGQIQRYFDNGKLGFRHVDYESVLAVPYDVPIVGYGNKDVNSLRLWHSVPFRDEIDLDAFNNGRYSDAMRKRNNAEAITCFLYPNDNTNEGKMLRLKQEYLLVSAGMASIFRVYRETYGEGKWDEMAKHVSIHTNDTHPALCVPEMMRLLMDEEGLEWDQAWEITCGVCSYTNHTVLPEALEKWPQGMVQSLLPRVYMIIEEIDRRWKDSIPRDESWQKHVNSTAILRNDCVNMADLSIVGSHHVNGVAALHTNILIKDVFSDHYALHPEKFNNKTNGISHRRFMIQANPGLEKLINEAIGKGWQSDFDRIAELKQFENDPAFIEKLLEVKKQNKERLAGFIAKTSEIAIDPESVFDVQVKRIHAYKRQLLNALKVLDLYYQLKEEPNLDIHPYTFIFSGKAAAGYAFAKEVIKFICSVADLVNSDKAMEGKLKVVFVENFCVSNAQLIYPAADISEQISTAGKEASGTGNMKFMMNGAITLGTLDGANVEIHELVGDDNIMIFGLRAEETEHFYTHGGYSSRQLAAEDPKLKRLTESLINGTFNASNYTFWGIFNDLIEQNDPYFVLKDFASYTDAFARLDKIYSDRQRWGRMSLNNIAMSSFFSSDRTIREYVKDIWHTNCN